MNENLDLTKILEGCPKGTEFYSVDYGTVYFDSITEHEKYPINFRKGSCICVFAKDGRKYTDFDGECVIFPSRDQRDWSKFEQSWKRFDPKTLQPLDKVLVRDINTDEWHIDLFSHISNFSEFVCVGGCWAMAIPYNGDTKHLLGKTCDCDNYYKWW